MGLQINLKNFDKHVDTETGAILFYKKGFKGIPDRVINGNGCNIEIKDNDVVLFDIYNPQIIISKLLEENLKTAAHFVGYEQTEEMSLIEV